MLSHVFLLLATVTLVVNGRRTFLFPHQARLMVPAATLGFCFAGYTQLLHCLVGSFRYSDTFTSTLGAERK